MQDLPFIVLATWFSILCIGYAYCISFTKMFDLSNCSFFQKLTLQNKFYSYTRCIRLRPIKYDKCPRNLILIVLAHYVRGLIEKVKLEKNNYYDGQIVKNLFRHWMDDVTVMGILFLYFVIFEVRGSNVLRLHSLEREA